MFSVDWVRLPLMDMSRYPLRHIQTDTIPITTIPSYTSSFFIFIPFYPPHPSSSTPAHSCTILFHPILSFTNLSHPIHRFSIPFYSTLSHPILICHTVLRFPIPSHPIPLGGHEGEGFEKKKSPHTRPRHGGGSWRQNNLSSLPN